MVNKETFLCQVCREQKKYDEIVPAQSVPEPIAELIRVEYPGWSSGGYICKADFDRFRAQYIGTVLEKEKSELAVLETDVRQSMRDHALHAKAPFIFKSQNRLDARARLNGEHDYQVNLNTEMEIHQLQKKIDHLLFNQGQRLLEIQKIQTELMEELVRKIR